MKTGRSALLIGALFGGGLALSGMGQPQRILDFLDFTGAWDPALALVMVGAIGVHFIAQRIARRRPAPLLVQSWPSYPFTRIDARLLTGAAIFGLGWGLVGFCPAPGILSAAAGTREALLFVPAMLAGMLLFEGMERLRSRPTIDETGAQPAAD
jgi:uncharacterized membrane protein YedE/YeeE